MNEKYKSITIVCSIFIVMLFIYLSINSVAKSWENTPTNWSINVNMDNETKESIMRISDMQEKIYESENTIYDSELAKMCSNFKTHNYKKNNSHEFCEYNQNGTIITIWAMNSSIVRSETHN